MIAQDYLQTIIEYQPETGLVFWKTRNRTDFKLAKSWTSWNRKYAKTQITKLNPSTGKVTCRIDDTQYSLDQIIYRLVTGEERSSIYHKNGCNADNRWDNLSTLPPGRKPSKYSGGDIVLSQVNGIYQIGSGTHIINFYADLREARTALMEFAEVLQVGWHDGVSNGNQ